MTFKATFPALHRHLAKFEKELRTRESRGKYWWEPQTSANPTAYSAIGIIYQEIQFYPCYAFNNPGELSNNKTFIIPSSDYFLLSVLNSPLMWWHNWRFLPHMKDEALSPMSFRMELVPIAPMDDNVRLTAQLHVEALVTITQQLRTVDATIRDWLRHEFGVDKPGTALNQPHVLDDDAFVAAVRKALPRSRKFSAVDIARLKQEHADTLQPAGDSANEVLALERKLSDLVNAAYGLTPEEVKLMWDTAPPRMPFAP